MVSEDYFPEGKRDLSMKLKRYLRFASSFGMNGTSFALQFVVDESSCYSTQHKLKNV
jgi:hypothetical protein